MKMLLAVVTLAAATPAAADPWAAKPVTVQPPAPIAMQADALVDGVLATFGVTRPRQLPTGAPACGNVQSKMPRSACEPVITAQATSTAPSTATVASSERR